MVFFSVYSLVVHHRQSRSGTTGNTGFISYAISFIPDETSPLTRLSKFSPRLTFKIRPALKKRRSVLNVKRRSFEAYKILFENERKERRSLEKEKKKRKLPISHPSDPTAVFLPLPDFPFLPNVQSVFNGINMLISVLSVCSLGNVYVVYSE